MKKILSQNLRFAFCCLLLLVVFTGSGLAQTSTFTYQGSLTIGGTLANGSYDLQFKLYDQLAAGALQGAPNTVTVSGVLVTAGVFTVELDFGAAAFPGAARFLEISVRPAGSGGFTTLTPRQQLSSTPYAIRSLSAASADTAMTATTATSATSATSFSGSLSGDVTGTQSATVVANVGGVTASNVASGAAAANNATSANTPSAIVKRDASGNFTAGTVTATDFSGSGSNLTSLNASNILFGTLADARLSSNVATLDADQTFTGGKIFSSINGLLATGTFNSGSIPATGAGQRMMWYPKKIAFRAGSVNSTEWDDANIGLLSVAMGNSTKASGNASFAMGTLTTASGTASVALGSSTTASGLTSVALGSNTTASGSRTTALGYFASTNGNDGSFVYGDNSTTTLLNATAANQFNVRAASGLRLFASSDTSDETKPGLFISGTTGDTQINGNLSVSGAFNGSGVSLTNLNATNITSGTLSDSLLSSNVAKLNIAQIFTANQTVNANLIQSGSLVQFTPTNGFVVGGSIDSGSIPATGSGTRMMWYPNKTAFRAGTLSNGGTSTYWDDSNIGVGSVALGQDTLASGATAFAMGFNAKATNDASAAIGYYANASGSLAVALGNCVASGDNAACLGGGFSSGFRSIATGSSTTASGDHTTAMGRYASTNGMNGSFVYGDASTLAGNVMTATAINQFNVRAAGGYRFFASSNTSSTSQPGLFISGTTGDTQVNGNLTVSGSISGTISGSGITNLNASNISNGVLAIANGGTGSSTQNFVDLSSNQTSIGGNKTFTGTLSASTFSGSGSGLTSLNGSNISSGTLNDARLSSNVALENAVNVFTNSQTINANLIQSGTLVQFTPTDGFVAKGVFNSGSIPATGGGVRMMWYPNKAAFRAGRVSGSQWDDANIGDHSVALGQDGTASGSSAVALGQATTASGNNSVALGY
ncbi:MAG: hypothetical protein ABI977_00720, partial [Acidobacteriota bacterium]